MKILAVGDIHGRRDWKKIHPADYDQIVFVGDYSDSKTLPPSDVIENLEEIIAFKIQHTSKIILLLGNHDIQYSEYPKYKFSGLSAVDQPKYSALFDNHKGLFQAAHQIGNYLFTHAGISDAYARLELSAHYNAIIKHEINVADLLNEFHNGYNQAILHTISPIRGGYDRFGGITWADFSETSASLLPGYHQIVGHTPVKQFTRIGDTASSITYIDVLGTHADFYELTIDD